MSVTLALVVLIILTAAYGWPAAALAFVGMVAVFIGTARSAEQVERLTNLEDPDA